MSKRPWMPLDIGDYLRDTGHLTVTEHGAYMLLIMHYWLNGGLPADEKLIARISRMTPDQWAESRDVIAALFRDGWRHKRIDEEVAKAEEIIGKRKAAANSRYDGSKRSANAEHVNSKSTYTGVPPEPSPEPVIEPPASLTEPGARDFEEVLEVFPRNPQCSETRALAAWQATKVKDRPAILAAARRRALWFAEDCEARDRTPDAGKRFEPFLATWIESEDWRKPLVLKADANKPDPNIVLLTRDDPVIPVLERKRGKPFLPESVIGAKIGARLADVEAARAELVN